MDEARPVCGGWEGHAQIKRCPDLHQARAASMPVPFTKWFACSRSEGVHDLSLLLGLAVLLLVRKEARTG